MLTLSAVGRRVGLTEGTEGRKQGGGENEKCFGGFIRELGNLIETDSGVHDSVKAGNYVNYWAIITNVVLLFVFR